MGRRKKSSKNRASFSFLQLPREIRRIVYSYLTLPPEIAFTTHQWPRLCHLKLTKICRQIRMEFLAEQYHGRQLAICDANDHCSPIARRYLEVFGPQIIPTASSFELHKGLYMANIVLNDSQIEVGVKARHRAFQLQPHQTEVFERRVREVVHWGIRRREDGSYFVGRNMIDGVLKVLKAAVEEFRPRF